VVAISAQHERLQAWLLAPGSKTLPPHLLERSSWQHHLNLAVIIPFLEWMPSLIEEGPLLFFMKQEGSPPIDFILNIKKEKFMYREKDRSKTQTKV
jgi:hypothetical protein